LGDFTYHERQFLNALDDECVRFLVVGSWALALHGIALEPVDLDVLIGTDLESVQAFLWVWDRVEPVNYRRTLRGAPAAFQQVRVTLGAGHADALTAVRCIDFGSAWLRRELRAGSHPQVPVLARMDLIAALESSERPQDSERLAVLQRRP